MNQFRYCIQQEKRAILKRLRKKLKKKEKMTVFWSLLLYGSETWALIKYERDRLKAFEM